MPAKGPKTFGGINAKSGKVSESQFDDLLKMAGDYDGDSPMYENNPTLDKLKQIIPAELTPEQQEAIKQYTEEPVQSAPEPVADVPQPVNNIDTPVTPVNTPVQNTSSDLILGERRVYKIYPDKPFNQQQPRRTQQNALPDTSTVQEQPQEAVNPQPTQILNIEKEPEPIQEPVPQSEKPARRTLTPSVGLESPEPTEKRKLRPLKPTVEANTENVYDGSDDLDDVPQKTRKLGGGKAKKEKPARKEKPAKKEKLSRKEKKEKQPKAPKAAKAEKQPKQKRGFGRRVVEDIPEDNEQMLVEDVQETSTKKGKGGKAKANKPLKPISPEKLKKKGFPKKYYDPTDIETDPQSGEEGYFFNIEKTLRNNNLLWISKIIPIDALDRLTYDKPLFDGYAVKQHEKAVRLNNSSAEEQYRYESRNNAIKILVASVVVLLIVFNVMFNVVPNNRYQNAMNFYYAEDWPNAYNSFTALGDHEKSKYYAKYSEAMMELEQKKYDEAKDDFTLLLNYQEYFEQSIEEQINQCIYKKGMDTYSQGKFKEAMNIFAKIPEYSDATNYYYKCGYRIADGYYESGDLQNAIDSFYKVRAYEDANTRLSDIALQMYTLAQSDYAAQRYEEASDAFTFLSKYNYKDSKSMIEQCTYRNALNKYADGSYEESRRLFEKILNYKDSNSMYKECTYNIAKIKYAESIESALKEYCTIPNYRDVPTILKQGVFSLFGEWQLLEMNGQKTTPIEFKFNTGGLFQSNKQVLYVAISTDANPITYKWDGEKYTTLDGNYSLSAEPAENENEIYLTCTEPDKSVVFRCLRKADYLTMLENNNNDGSVTPTEDETEEESLNSAITTTLQDYVDKKLDGKVVVGGKEYNALMIIQQINERLGK